MEALKVLIVEDEITTAQDLEELLIEANYSITSNVSNSDDALRAFHKQVPDLVLLDIQLEGSKLDGIQLAQEFNKTIQIPIIFLTAFYDDKTKERAKATNPAYYLIKPCNQTQLEVAIEFAISNFAKGEEAEIRHSLRFHSIPKESFYPLNHCFFIKTIGSRLVRVDFSNLLFVQASDTSVEIITKERKFILSANLKSFCRQFPHPFLVRVHRSYAVNISKVLAIEDNYLILGKSTIPIGKIYREEVSKAIIRLRSD